MLVTLNKNTWKCQNFFKAICGAFEVVKQNRQAYPKNIRWLARCVPRTEEVLPRIQFFQKSTHTIFYFYTISPHTKSLPSYTRPRGIEKFIFKGRGYKIKNPPLRRDVLFKSGIIIYIVKVFVVSIVLLFLSQFFARNYFFIL